MHFNAVAGLALSLVGSASALAAPKLPASGLCPNGQYWDTGKGCSALPPPQKCSSTQYYDSLKGCVAGQPPSGPPGVLCTIVKTLVKVARQDFGVTSYCSSYLRIPISTKTETVTAYTTLVTSTSTITSGVTTTTDSTKTTTDSTTTTVVTQTDTITTKSTTKSAIFTATTVTIHSCAPPVFRKAKRGDGEEYEPSAGLKQPHHVEERGVAKPGALSGYVDPAAVSYACNCFDIPTSTTTELTTLRTTTKTVSVTVPSTTTATATSKVTATSTSTTTKQSTVYTETVTERTTYYTSTQYILEPTVSLLAIGAWINGSPMFDDGGLVGIDDPFQTPLLFTLNPDGTLRAQTGGGAGLLAQTNPLSSGQGSLVLFDQSDPDLQPMTCTVSQNSAGLCPMSCSGSRGPISFDCGSYWGVGNRDDTRGCRLIVPYAVGS
ncbi:hypothetical protein ACHAPT_009869 [Fusarium lateritium]